MRRSGIWLWAFSGVSMCIGCGGGAAGGTSPSGGGGGTAPAAATHFSVTSNPSAVLGTPTNLIVTALDANNATVTTYSGTVHFTSTDPAANLPTNAAVAGEGEFAATFNTAGAQTITATDVSKPTITGVSNVVTVSRFAHLVISSGAPPSGEVGKKYDFHCEQIPPCNVFAFGFAITAKGGEPPYSWSMTGSLPPGLLLGECQNVGFGICGTPKTAGQFTFNLILSDSEAPPMQTSQSYTIDIRAANAAADDANASAAGSGDSAPVHHYKLVDLGSTLGGPQSYLVPGSGQDFSGSSVLADAGFVVGFADTAEPDPFPSVCFWDCSVVHTFISSSQGVMTDLGALPGGGSSIPMWISPRGGIAGVSENGETDPLIAGLPEVRAVLWKNGKIINLGTLPEGGYQSEANAVNGSGQVVGAALNTVPDANSMQQPSTPIGPGGFWLWGGFTPPYLYQMRAFLWDERDGMRDLGTLPGGTDAQAVMINDAGQVIGFSYTASTQPGACFPVPVDAFIWEKGKGMTDLGGLGGTCTLVAAINEHGQVVGESYTAGDQSAPGFLWEHGVIHELEGSLGGDFTGPFALNERGESVGFGNLAGDALFHAALWRNVKSITDLGTIGSDLCSFAGAINDTEQIVGSSFATCDPDTGAVRAILWQGGSLFDLNTLIPPDSALSLQFANAINDRGEITGTAVDASGNSHVYLLIPCDEHHPDVDGCDYANVDQAALAGKAAARSAPAPRGSSNVHRITGAALLPTRLRLNRR